MTIRQEAPASATERRALAALRRARALAEANDGALVQARAALAWLQFQAALREARRL